MIAKAKVSFVRMSPRKIRYVLDPIRSKPVPIALSILNRTPRRASGVVKKLIAQAVDSAKKQKQTNADELYVSKIFADGAGMMKRFRAMSMGRAGLIRKRMSHVVVELDRLPEAARYVKDRWPRRDFHKESETPKGTLKSKEAQGKTKAKKKLAGAKK